MKSLYLFLSLIIIVSFSGCTEDKITKVDLGDLTHHQWIYENKTFNFKFPLPNNWFLMRRTAGFPDSRVGDISGLVGGKKKQVGLEEFKETPFGKTVHLFSVVDNDEKDLTNIRMKVDVHVVETDIENEEEFLKSIHEKAASLAKADPHKLTFEEIRIGEQVFKITRTQFENNGKKLTIAPSAKTFKNLKLMIAYTYESEEEFKKLMEFMKSKGF